MTNALKLTDALIKSLKPGTYTDAGCGLKGASLELRISPKGKRAFDLFYRNPAGKRCRLGSKVFRECERVGQARKRAEEAWRDLCAGGDPASERRANRETGTLGELAETYCTSYLDKGGSDAYANDVLRVVKGDKIAVMPARTVTTKDIDAFLKRRQNAAQEVPQARGGKAAVVRARAYLVRLYNHAGIVPNPAVAPRETHNTKAIRIERARAKGRGRLTLEEIAERCRALWQEAHGTAIRSQDGRDLTLLVLLFGNRKSEVLWMRWEQIDWRRRLWLVPSDQPGNKSAEPDEVPLTDAAIAVLTRRHTPDAAGLIFPSASGRRAGKPYCESYLNRIVTGNKDETAICQRHGFHMTVHDIRRLMASWCRTQPRHKWAIPHVLNHAAKHGDAVDRLYAQGDDTEALRETMQAFENWVREQAEGKADNVHKFQGVA